MRRALLHAGLAAAVAVAALGALSPAAPAAVAAAPLPQAAGKVVFVQNGQIWAANADGSSPTQLTNEGNNVDPHFSPDGTQIVFASNRDNDKNPLSADITLWHLYVMSADGSGQRLVTPRNQMAISPIFSPDGGYIFFIRDYGYSGTLPKPPAGQQQGQPPQGQAQGQPPQGQGARPGQPQPTPAGPPPTPPPPTFSFTNAISLLNLADNTISNIAATEQPKEAPFIYTRVAPDGQTLLYQVQVPTAGRGIELINVDGSNKRTIYFGEENTSPLMYNPYFFADGSRILYSVQWFTKDQQNPRAAIEWVSVDGSSRQEIVKDAPAELQAAIPSPDGTQMLVSLSKQTGQKPEERTDEIFVYNIDGTRLSKVADGYMPDWAPARR